MMQHNKIKCEYIYIYIFFEVAEGSTMLILLMKVKRVITSEIR
jgi:hypothetical protein